jgi:hypothetical protein
MSFGVVFFNDRLKEEKKRRKATNKQASERASK